MASSSFLTRRNWLVLGFVALLFGIPIVLTDGCTDAVGARRKLLAAGYKPLEVGGRGWGHGHRGEWYVTRFRAVHPTGDTVSGVVGRGFTGDGDIRLNR